MTTLPQTTAIRLPRPSGPTQLATTTSNLPALAAGSTAAGAMTGNDVWRVIRAHMWLIVGMLVVSAVGGYFVNMLLASRYPRFTATGLIEVQPVLKSVIDRMPNSESVDSATLMIEQKTQAQMLKSETLLSKVLQNDSGEIRKTSWFKRFNSTPEAKLDFVDNYVVTPVPDTRLVRIDYTSAIPKDCQTIVREMVSQHIEDEREKIFLEGQSLSQQLNALKTHFQGQKQDIEARLIHLRNRVQQGGGGLMSRVNIKEMELEQLRRDQSTLEINLKSSQGQLDSIKAQLAQGIDPPMVEQMVDQNGQLLQYKSLVDNYQFQFDTATDKYGPENQQVKSLQKALERAKQKAADFEAEARQKARNMVLDSLTTQVTSAKKQLDDVVARMDDLTNSLGEVTNEMARYFATESELKGITDVLKKVTDQLDELQTHQEQKLSGKVKWSQMPEIPSNRSFPQLKVVMPVSIALGLMIALGIAFLREMTDTTVRTPRDIQRVGQMALLGLVGDENDDPQAAGARLPLVIFDAPHSMTAEQLRQVRTRLQHAASLDTTRSLLVTSPSPGDGKTTIACNLAAGLALNGRRILLVDGNFRRPEIHKVFALANEQGFSDVLNGAVTFDEVVQETAVPNLAVMTSGPKPINATEMFESQLLIDFIERALEEFDHVIFDSGPMMVVSESAAMAPRVDGVISVVRARGNSRGLLTRMRDSLRAVKAEHLGVVLNGVRAQGGGYYARNIKTYYEYQT